MNQRLHGWSFGKFPELLTYKAELVGMKVVLQNERDTHSYLFFISSSLQMKKRSP